MKQVTSLMLLLLSVLSLSAFERRVEFDGQTLLLTYELGPPEILTSPIDTTARYVSIEGFGHVDEVGRPALPRKNDSFQIPDGLAISSFEVTTTSQAIPMVYAAADIPQVESEDLDASIPEISPYSGIWPESAAVFAGAGIYRDVNIANIELMPAQYDYENRILIFNSKIEIVISFSVEEEEIDSILHTILDEELSGMIDFTLPANSSQLQRSQRKMPSFGGYITRAPGYLVVAPVEFKEAADKFATWKRRMGYNVYVRTASQTQLGNPEFTKSMIQQEYYSDYDLRYVLLLGGGYLIKPFEGKFPQPTDNILITSGKYQYCTDHYFACMDGESDVYADLILGRMPAKTLAEAQTMVTKTIEYEMNPPLAENYFNNGVHIGIFEGGVKGKDTRRFALTAEETLAYMESQGWNMERLYKKHMSVSYPTPTSWSQKYYADVELPPHLKEPYFGWNASYYDVKNAVENGVAYMLYRGHGAQNYLATIDVTASQLSKYSNKGKYPIFFSITCNSGTFYNEFELSSYNRNYISVSDAFLSNPNGGGVCMIGANQVSYSGYNDIFSLAIFDAIYPNPGLTSTIPQYTMYSVDSDRLPIVHIGDLFNYGMRRMFESKGQSEFQYKSTPARYSREVFHILGDPTLPFYTNPLIDRGVTLMCIGGKIVMVDGRDMVLVDKETNEVSIHSGVNSRDLSEWRDQYYISLIKDGYLPLVDGYVLEASEIEVSSIDSIQSSESMVEVDYTSSSDDVNFALYDIYGNKIAATRGLDGSASLSGISGFKILVMEVDGVVVDSKSIK